MLDDGGSAMLDHCFLASPYLGVVAKSETTLSMYSSSVGGVWCGLYAGVDGDVLEAGTHFGAVLEDRISRAYENRSSEQLVQPWRVWKTRPAALRAR